MCERECHWGRKGAVTAPRTGSYPRIFGSGRRLQTIDSMIQVHVIKSASATINTQGSWVVRGLGCLQKSGRFLLGFKTDNLAVLFSVGMVLGICYTD